MRKVPSKQNAIEKNGNNVNQERAQGRSLLIQWFPQWWGWYNSTSVDNLNNSIVASVQTNPAPDLEGEILDVIADSIENNTLLKRDTIFGQFKFMLNKGSLQLCTLLHSATNNDSHKYKLYLHEYTILWTKVKLFFLC